MGDVGLVDVSDEAEVQALSTNTLLPQSTSKHERQAELLQSPEEGLERVREVADSNAMIRFVEDETSELTGRTPAVRVARRPCKIMGHEQKRLLFFDPIDAVDDASGRGEERSRLSADASKLAADAVGGATLAAFAQQWEVMAVQRPVQRFGHRQELIQEHAVECELRCWNQNLPREPIRSFRPI